MAKIKPEDLVKTDALALMNSMIVVSWSDGKKEVISGMTYITNFKYLSSTSPSQYRKHIEYVEILSHEQARILYGPGSE